MCHLFAGFSGLVTGVLTFAIVWLAAYWQTKEPWVEFDALGEKGAFERLLPIYLRIAEFIVGLASGSIVLLIGTSAFRIGGKLPWQFASPLFLLTCSILYGILFMVFEVFNYEAYRHHPGQHTYTRFKYVRNQTLGFGALICFCSGYLWLIVIVTR
jgi:hypothetical protein